MRDKSRAPQPAEVSAPAAQPHVLVAVLPFENISKGGEAYFAAGMTEEVTSQLSKLGGLRVVSRTAVAQFKDPRSQLAAMSTELGVGSVVAGTVREDGKRVRVNVELIDTKSGQVLWSEQYDREGVDVFAAQSDIALRVASALNASVTLEERARVGKRPTSSVAAYELYIRSRGRQPGKTSEERRAAEIALLRQAVAVDPQFAEAYAQLAYAYYFQGAYGDLPALALGIEAANKAIQIDPQLAAGHFGLGLNLTQLGRIQEALKEYRSAAELGPSDTRVLYNWSYGETMAGHFDVALDVARRATELSPVGGYHVGVALLLLDDDAQTERYLTAKAERYPNDMRLQALLAFLDLRRGQPKAAVERMRAAVDKAPDNIEGLITRAEVLTFAETPDAPEVVRALNARAADGTLHNAPYPVKLLHAYYLQRAGATAEAEKIMDAIAAANRQSLIAGADSAVIYMQNAAINALRGNAAAALDELARAYDAGWRDGRTLAIDPLYASLRSEPRFVQLLANISADVAQMRARVDYTNLP
jgi:TolB-like protein/Tfp pilus assembly protein PilF